MSSQQPEALRVAVDELYELVEEAVLAADVRKYAAALSRLLAKCEEFRATTNAILTTFNEVNMARAPKEQSE